MDSLDARILRAMTGGLFGGSFGSTAQSLRSIAWEIGADKETVRNHMLRLERKGIIVGWRTMINPGLRGMEATRVWGEVPSEKEKERVITRLSKIPSVRVVYDYFERGISFVMAGPSAGGFSIGPPETLGLKDQYIARISFPTTMTRLSEGDWSIYNSIRDDPYKVLRLVSRETGFAIRTLKRRIAKLSRGNAILIFPVLQPGKLDGVVCDMLVKFSKPGDIIENILAEAGDSIVRVEHYKDSCVLFSLIAPNLTMARTLLKKARSTVGVTSAEVHIVQEMILPSTRLEVGGRKQGHPLEGGISPPDAETPRMRHVSMAN